MSGGALDALLGMVQSNGAEIELASGLNFTGGLIAELDETNNIIRVTFDPQVRTGFRGVYYVDPLSTATELGSEYAPFKTATAAIAYAVAQGITSGLLKLPPGAVLNEAFAFPTTGTWEIETESTGASAVINGNISISNTGGASYLFSRVTLNGNITGAKSGASTATSTLFLRSVFQNGGIALTNTGGGNWSIDTGGVGGNFNGSSGYVLNAVSVAGGIIAENFSFYGNLSYSIRSRFAFVQINQSVVIAPGTSVADTLMVNCNFGGGVSIVGTGNPPFSVDGHTLSSMGNATAQTTVSGVALKTNNANGSIEITNSAAGNLAGQFLMFGAAGMYTARAFAHLITSGGTGTLLIDVNYVDARGNAKTLAITSTGLLLSGTAGTEDGATTRVFYHNGSAAITATIKGVTGAGATVRIGIACRREN